MYGQRCGKPDDMIVGRGSCKGGGMEGTISSAYETSISTYTLDLGGEIRCCYTCDGVRLEAGKCDVMPGKYDVTLRRLRRFMQAWEEMRICAD